MYRLSVRGVIFILGLIQLNSPNSPLATVPPKKKHFLALQESTCIFLISSGKDPKLIVSQEYLCFLGQGPKLTLIKPQMQVNSWFVRKNKLWSLVWSFNNLGSQHNARNLEFYLVYRLRLM